MLVPSQEGELIGQKAETLERVAPTEYNYSSLPPYAERYFPFGKLIRGAGEKTQSGPGSQSYFYALGADCSIGGYPVKGPLFRGQSGAGEVRDAVAALDGGVVKEFSASGRYVRVRNGDGLTDWAVSKDFGVGRQVQQMVRFKNAGATVVDALYVGLDNGQWWRYDGTTWTQGPVAEADASAAYGYLVEVADDRLYRATGASGNVLRSCTNDPFTMANWSGPITVGDASSPLTWLRAWNKALIAFKTIGPFGVQADGTVEELLAEMRAQPAATNGRGAWAWAGYLWFRHGDGYWRLAPDGDAAVAQPIGPERLLANDSETRGVTTCGAGHGTAFAYFGVYNAANGNSYLWKFGTWLNPQETDAGKWEFAEAYHGALAKWTGKQITAMRVSNTAAGNSRLFCFFADGSVEWAYLPAGTPNPWASGSGCEFTAATAYVYAPDFHAMFQADDKAFRGFSVFGPILDANNTATVLYRVPPSPTDLSVGPYSFSGQRVDAADKTDGKMLRYALKLDSTTSATTPVVESVALHHSVRPSLLLHYRATVDAQAYRARLDGMADRKTPEQIRTAVKGAAATVGAVTVWLPDEAAKSVLVVDYAERQKNRGQRYGLGWHLDVAMIEFKTYTIYGTYGRLRPYRYGDLRVLTYGQLRTI